VNSETGHNRPVFVLLLSGPSSPSPKRERERVVKRTLLVCVLSLVIILGVLPSRVALAASAGSWFLSSVTHPGESSCLEMSLTGPASSDNVRFNTSTERTWLADDSAQGTLSFPSGTWKVVLKTGSDWGNDLDIKLGYWDTSFHSFENQSFAANRFGGLTTIEILITTTSHTLDTGDYLALWIQNVGANPHHIVTGESRVETPPSDPGYPLPEWGSGALAALGFAGIGLWVCWHERSRFARQTRSKLRVV
jgi:hypothetical protein